MHSEMLLPFNQGRLQPMNIKNILTLLIGSFYYTTVLSSCSLLEVSDEEKFAKTPNIRQVKDLELTFSRASLGGEEFEHYALSGEILFYECGAIKFGKFSPIEKGIKPVPRQIVKPLRLAINQTLLALDDNSKLRPAERGSSLSDAGLFTLTWQEQGKPNEKSIETSLDAIVSRTKLVEKRIYHLVSIIRSVPPNIVCRNREFFGLKRE
jgi:hypothetical protein